MQGWPTRPAATQVPPWHVENARQLVTQGCPTSGGRAHRDSPGVEVGRHCSSIALHDAERFESQICPEAAFVAQMFADVQ